MINETIEQTSSDIVQGFRDLLEHDSITSAISDCMGRLNAVTMSALNRGVVAAIIDGACRDVEEIRKIIFPVLS